MLDLYDLENKELNELIKKNKTPIFIFDLNKVRDNFRKFKRLFPNFRIFYSVKTNSLGKVVSILNQEGSSFDAATTGEIKLLSSRKIQSDRILFTHPVKLPEAVTTAMKLNIENYTFDCLEELKQLAKYAPKKNYFLRILPPIGGTFYEYGDKFGASKEDVKQLFAYAKGKNLKISGLSFHVGSQNMSLEPWQATLNYCREIIREYYRSMPSLRVVNIGGGFPFAYKSLQCPSLESISEYIHQIIKAFPKDTEFWAEPGRVIVADAAILVCTVLRSIERTKNRWIFIDMGVYHGLIEVLESRGKLNYHLETFRKGNQTLYNISGNTLDPDDNVAIEVSLPEDIEAGDKLIIKDVGAYTVAFFTQYHSLEDPVIQFAKKF